MLRNEKRSIETYLVVKLAPRYYGQIALKIIEHINANSFRLAIPSSKIHNAFHISLLHPYKYFLSTLPIVNDPPLLEEDSEILILEALIDHQETLIRSE